MWLLDVNIPNGLVGKLNSLGIVAETTAERGWRNMGNGKLAELASKAGFLVIITRDRLFGESAGKALVAFPDLAVVILKIPQAKESLFLGAFEKLWIANPISPVVGRVSEWP